MECTSCAVLITLSIRYPLNIYFVDLVRSHVMQKNGLCLMSGYNIADKAFDNFTVGVCRVRLSAKTL